jgi:uncharacterized protein (DUF1330 family)
MKLRTYQYLKNLLDNRDGIYTDYLCGNFALSVTISRQGEIMSTFYLLQISVKDPVKLKKYTDAAPATVTSFGGELVFRGKVSGISSGQPEHSSAVVLKFPDKTSANGWYASKDYQDLVGIRNEGADVIATRYDEPDFF